MDAKGVAADFLAPVIESNTMLQVLDVLTDPIKAFISVFFSFFPYYRNANEMPVSNAILRRVVIQLDAFRERNRRCRPRCGCAIRIRAFKICDLNTDPAPVVRGLEALKGYVVAR